MLIPLRDKIIVKPEQRFTSALLDLSLVQGADTVGYVIAVGPEAADVGLDRKSTRLNSSHSQQSRMPSSA